MVSSFIGYFQVLYRPLREFTFAFSLSYPCILTKCIIFYLAAEVYTLWVELCLSLPYSLILHPARDGTEQTLLHCVMAHIIISHKYLARGGVLCRWHFFSGTCRNMVKNMHYINDMYSTCFCVFEPNLLLFERRPHSLKTTRGSLLSIAGTGRPWLRDQKNTQN